MGGPLSQSDFAARCGKVRALVLDVDGVMTDGKLTFLPDNRETKTFHVRDGLGIQLLIAAGLHVAVISGRESELVSRRCTELGVSVLLQGIQDKVEAVERIREHLDVTLESMAYVGDDLPDLPAFQRVGLAFAVADAAPEVRQAAHVVLRTNGGHGAVREACERVLKAQGHWNV